MKLVLAFLLCLFCLPAFAQTVVTTDTIVVLPTDTGLDSGGLPANLLQHGLEQLKPATSAIWYETNPDGSEAHYVAGDFSHPGWISTLELDPVTGHQVAHIEFYGTDNQGYYPGTAVPCHVVIDLTYTTHRACSGGRGGGCHQVMTIYSESVQITE